MKNAERSAADFVPPNPTLPKLREAATICTGCDLYKNATQAVFGEGSSHASMIFIGEQPGDQEDLQGRPFVGPAGQMLDKALDELEIPRTEIYITNAVKHFKWVPSGKRRLHKKPTYREVKACRPWLESEIALIKPRIVVCLGATAAQSLLGPKFRITQSRGQIFDTDWGVPVMATLHPSAILRAPDKEARDEAYRRFAEDLAKALPLL